MLRRTTRPNIVDFHAFATRHAEESANWFRFFVSPANNQSITNQSRPEHAHRNHIHVILLAPIREFPHADENRKELRLARSGTGFLQQLIPHTNQIRRGGRHLILIQPLSPVNYQNPRSSTAEIRISQLPKSEYATAEETTSVKQVCWSCRQIRQSPVIETGLRPTSHHAHP